MKVVDSQTRLEIIKSLKDRNKTLSELSRELGISKPSIYRHLKILYFYGIVERIKNGNKFVYYRLTEKGREVADLIVSLAVSALGSALAYTATYHGESVAFDISVEQAPKYAPAGGFPTPTPAKIVQTATDPVMASILAFVFIFVIVFFSIKLIRLVKSPKR
jgi:DNA-binding HxlR family transcriptional regulator